MYRSTCLIAFLALVAFAYAAPAGETPLSASPPREIKTDIQLGNRTPVKEELHPERPTPIPILEKQTPIQEPLHQAPRQLTPIRNEKPAHDSPEDHDLDTDATHHYGYYSYYAPGWSGWAGRSYGWHDGWRSYYW